MSQGARLKNNRGGVILYVLVIFPAILFIIFQLGSQTAIANKEQLRVRTLVTMTMLQNNLKAYLNDPAAWIKTISDATANANLSCIKTHTNCAVGSDGALQIKDPSGNVAYNAVSTSSGFNSAGAPCNTYGSILPGNDCLLRADVTWKADCILPCTPTQIKISVDFAITWPVNYSLVKLNTAPYHFEVVKDVVAIIDYCNIAQTYGGSNNGPRNYTWTKPVGCTSAAQAKIQLWGGGGLGGYGYGGGASYGAGGGGGGGYSELTVLLSSLPNSVAITVGQGGWLIGWWARAAAGDSAFGSLLSAGAGSWGADGGTSPRAGGAGGIGSTQNGVSGTSSSSLYGEVGGKGGSNILISDTCSPFNVAACSAGAPGQGGNATNGPMGIGGRTPGGGGGGAQAESDSNACYGGGCDGGAGGYGQCIITITDP